MANVLWEVKGSTYILKNVCIVAPKFSLPLLFPLFQSTLSGPRSVVLDRVSVAAEGAVSCEATSSSSSSAAPPSFQTERGSIDLTVVSLPAKTPPGLFGILAFCLFCT